MTIEDANLQDPTASAAPVINEDAIADKIFARMQSSMNATKTPEQRDNVLATAYQAYQKAGLDHDVTVANLTALKALQDDMQAQTLASMGTLARAQAEKDRDVNGFGLIRKLIKEYAKEEPRIGKIGETIFSQVIAKFNSSDARKAEWGSNVVNADAIEKIVDDVVADISKEVLGIDKAKSGSVVKGKSTTPPKTDGEKEGGGSSMANNIDELNDDQLEFYNARVSNLQRWEKKSKADAQKEAFEAAKALPKYSPRGISVAAQR